MSGDQIGPPDRTPSEPDPWVTPEWITPYNPYASHDWETGGATSPVDPATEVVTPYNPYAVHDWDTDDTPDVIPNPSTSSIPRSTPSAIPDSSATDTSRETPTAIPTPSATKSVDETSPQVSPTAPDKVPSNAPEDSAVIGEPTVPVPFVTPPSTPRRAATTPKRAATWNPSVTTATPIAKKVALLAGGALTVLVLIAAAVGFIMDASYSGKALPGSTLAGQDVSGMTAGQVRDIATQLAGTLGADITIGEKTVHATGNDLGIAVDVNATVRNVTEVSHHFWWIYSERHGTDAGLDLTQNTDTLDAWLAASFPDAITPPVDASIAFDAEAGTWQVTESTPGVGLTADDIASLKQTLSTTPDGAQLTFTPKPVEATISDEAAAQAQTLANKTIAAQITLTGTTIGDAGDYVLSPADIASCLTVSPSQSALTVTADTAKVEALLTDTIAPKVDVAAVTERSYVNDAGSVVAVMTKGVDGRALTGISDLAAAIATQINQGNAPASIPASFDTTPFSTEKVSAPTTKVPTSGHWADVDLTSQTVTLMDGSTPVAMFVVSTGAEGHTTPEGTFQVYYKTASQSLTGCVDGDCYNFDNVKWCTWFYSGRGGIGFHTAYWHNDFGLAVSHGCINMRENDAKQTYDWLPNGSTVIVHY